MNGSAQIETHHLVVVAVRGVGVPEKRRWGHRWVHCALLDLLVVLDGCQVFILRAENVHIHDR